MGLKQILKKSKHLLRWSDRQRFIGLVKYLSKFLQDLSELCEPLSRLTDKKAEWNWTHKQKDAFDKIKDAVSKVPVLKYFSESDPTEGFVLMY